MPLSNKPKLLPLLPKLSLLALLVLSCGGVQINDTVECAADGKLSIGQICTHSLNSDETTLTSAEAFDFLEAQPERTCVPVPGFNVCSHDQTTGAPVDLPARGAAIAQSALDYAMETGELETACRLLGSKCTVALQTMVARRQVLLRKMRIL